MSTVKYNVIQPPTGGEVEASYLDAILPNNCGRMTMTLFPSEQQVPPPKEEVVTFRIRRIGYPEIGSVVIEGSTDDREHISVIIGTEADQPATALIIKG